jgi:hypothetical protein
MDISSVIINPEKFNSFLKISCHILLRDAGYLLSLQVTILCETKTIGALFLIPA